MSKWQGPRAIAGLCYLGVALGLSGPFFSEGEERLDDLWDIYMSPMYDEENVWVLLLVILACFALGAAYFSSPFSSRLSEYLSRRDVGRILAGLSTALALVAMATFSRQVTMAIMIGALLSIWSWRKADPEDRWF
jgi:MFS family permease